MKNLLILFLVITFSSCTTHIYRGKVKFIDSSNKKLIELFGTNQSLWYEGTSLILNDIVEIKTSNNFGSFEVEKICSPELDHCHFEGSGAHSRTHIKELQRTNPLPYNGKIYYPAEMKYAGTSTWNEVYLEDSYDPSQALDPNHINGPSIFTVLLLDGNLNPQIINGKYLIIDFTYQDHPGH